MQIPYQVGINGILPTIAIYRLFYELIGLCNSTSII